MRYVFGNFVVQMILENGSAARVSQIFACIRMQVRELCFHKFGCRIVQKAIEVLPLEQQQALIGELSEDDVVDMMTNDMGNHVLQRMIQSVRPTSEVDFIVRLASQSVIELCMDVNGCRIIQRLLEFMPRAQIKAPIVDVILSHVTQLTPTDYGNYVIVNIMEKGQEDEKARVVDAIKDDVIKYSLNKLGSNVVESCLSHAPAALKLQILDRIIGVQVMDGELSLVRMIENDYANYVI